MEGGTYLAHWVELEDRQDPIRSLVEGDTFRREARLEVREQLSARILSLVSTGATECQHYHIMFSFVCEHFCCDTKFLCVPEGAGSYKPTGVSGGGDSTGPANPFFPQKTFISFDQANSSAIIGKYI